MFPIRDTVQSRGTPLVTWGLIILNGFIFLNELDIPEDQINLFIHAFGMIPARLKEDPSAWWTLITSMFLHGGWAHIIGNMWTLYIFGDDVEDRMGSIAYLAFYLICGLAAGTTHFLTNQSSLIPTIGASGAVAGVLGAYFVLFPTARVITLIPILIFPFFVEIPAVFYLGVWFFSQLISGTLAPASAEQYEGVAWWAHVGGFLTGAALLPAFKKSRRAYRKFYPDEYRPW
jgi:membrane associated rhomboid family serine protease